MAILVAIDDMGADAAEALAERLCGVVEGFKLGLPFILANGAHSLQRVRRGCSRGLWVADLKLADIGYVMKLVASRVIDGVDAVIAHGFVGVKGALDELKEYLDSRGRKLVVVATMSHPGAVEVYDKALQDIINVIKELKPWGLVAPATRPSIVERLHSLFPEAVILSPGVGAQGARPGTALCHGASYEIIGRMITRAPDPLEAARAAKREQEEMLQACRG